MPVLGLDDGPRGYDPLEESARLFDVLSMFPNHCVTTFVA